jgi:hypothetical protein
MSVSNGVLKTSRGAHLFPHLDVLVVVVSRIAHRLRVLDTVMSMLDTVQSVPNTIWDVSNTTQGVSNTATSVSDWVSDTVIRGSHLFPNLDVLVVVVPRIVKVLPKLPNPG